MYPRNAASPPRIAIGAVVLIADGTVQTSGVSVVVIKEGGSEASAGGTIAYSSASGVVYYTPTQAETDATTFIVVAYKSACLPVAQTIVTSSSSTAGVVVTSDTSNVSAIKAKTDNLPAAPAATGDIPTALANADALLGRNIAGGSNGGRTVSTALYPLRNKWTVAGGTYSVYGTDDTTLSWSAPVTSTAGADPITGSDPG